MSTRRLSRVLATAGPALLSCLTLASIGAAQTSTSSTTTTTLSMSGCQDVPMLGCRVAADGKSVLKLQTKAGMPEKAKLDWKFQKGDATSFEAFMAPTTGLADYTVCVYDESSEPQPLMQMEVWPGGTCGTRRKPCWRLRGSKGYQYKDPLGQPNGVTQMLLKSGDAGKSSLRVRGKGRNLRLPKDLRLAMPVSVQLLIADGVYTECWQVMYADTPKKTAVDRFTVQGP